ncbi:hypothetical protein IFM89_012619 [Coptis chinensis]|uniref:Uncharacterized protein n=1 Tax=Coptis chinensis TaxID=261450 RepID=A0A835IPR2_9MAGN|nr:hypothetical protein IFM89_012619 [Coptis chinensis]
MGRCGSQFHTSLEAGRSYSVVLCEGKDGGEVRAPLPVKRDILYDDPMLYRAARMGYSSNEPSSLVAFRNFNEEMRRPGVWETGQSAEPSIDNLASLYRPPFALMHHNIKMRNTDVEATGSLNVMRSKEAASAQDKWLLVNLQSPKEFSSHMLNRDTWANEEGMHLLQVGIFPCEMRSWSGMVQPDSLLEDLLPFMDRAPKDNHAIPGAQNCLDYASNLTFEESGLASLMISVTWE